MQKSEAEKFIDNMEHAFYSLSGIAEDNLPDYTGDDDLDDYVQETRNNYDDALVEFKMNMDKLRDLLARSGQPLNVYTPIGTITAKVIPDTEYPGIGVFNGNPGEGEPGAILEYNPDKKEMSLRVYGLDDPDGDPAGIYPMSRKTKKGKSSD